MNIEHIFSSAKEVILAHGEYTPTLFIEYEKPDELIMTVLVGFGSESQTVVEKQQLLFLIGRKLSLAHEKRIPVQIALVTEAWTSETPRDEERKYLRPADDPARREVLIVSLLDVSVLPDMKESAYLAEMIRDGSGKLIDLLSMKEPITVNYNKLLESFFAGSLTAKWSDKKLKRLLEKYVQ